MLVGIAKDILRKLLHESFGLTVITIKTKVGWYRDYLTPIDWSFFLEKEGNMNYQIAIDGASSTGKSSTAKRVAKRLSFIYIDTGAMYRVVGLYCKRNNIDINNEEDIKKHLNKIKIDIYYEDGMQQINMNGEKVSDAIRENEISKYASIVSTYKSVREKLVRMQKKLARENSVIMDGRDIGTVVLPKATLKVYLVCDEEIRAKRRHKELLDKGQSITLEQVREELKERDYRDTHRENSPLMKASDAIEIDTSYLSLDEVTDVICKLFNEKVGNKK